MSSSPVNLESAQPVVLTDHLTGDCSPNIPKLRSIIYQFRVIVHSLDCHSNDCGVKDCRTMKDISQHLKYCTSETYCSVKYCLSSRRIIEHWVNCRNCGICKGSYDVLERHRVFLMTFYLRVRRVDTKETIRAKTCGQTDSKPIGQTSTTCSQPQRPKLINRQTFRPSIQTSGQTNGVALPIDIRQHPENVLPRFERKFRVHLSQQFGGGGIGYLIRQSNQIKRQRLEAMDRVVDDFNSLVLDSTIELDTE